MSRSVSAVSTPANTRLSGSRLVVARAAWLVLAVPNFVLFVASLPVYYERLQTACVDVPTCSFAGALTAKGLQALPALGLSPGGYAALLTLFFAFIAAIWCGIGFFIFWRRSDDWLALLAAFFLVMDLTTFPGLTTYALALTYPVLVVPTTIMSALGQLTIPVFFLLFPGGRLVPRWVALVLVIAIVEAVSSVVPPASAFNSNNWPGWLNALVFPVSYGAVIFSQIYRYRRASTPVQRQQTKWVVFGIITVLTGFIAFGLLFSALLPVPGPDSPPDSPLYVSIPNVAYPLLTLLLPLSIGMAILRYRLYDIDLIINRTLVYGTLTGALLLIYFGSVVLLEQLVRSFTSQTHSDLVVVASTLAIAALFSPLRKRIQAFIDRRFYRRKYDATKTLAAFSSALRDEVDLDRLTGRLVEVVEETIQPAHVSLWLRQPESKAR